MANLFGGLASRISSGVGSSASRIVSGSEADSIAPVSSGSSVWDAIVRNYIDEYGGAAAMRDGEIAAAGLTKNPYFPGAAASVSSALKDFVDATAPSSPQISVSSDAGTDVPIPEYLNADLAKAYGMDVSTAYQEALSNTSYQRAVKDLEAAGLNPILAATGLSGAGGVYGATVYGGNQSISTGVSSAKSNHTYYKVLSQLGTLAGAGYGFYKLGVKGAAIGGTVGNKVLGTIGNLLDAL